MKLKKIISVFLLIILVLFTSSCSLTDQIISNVGLNNEPVINVTGEKVTLNVSNNTTTYTDEITAIEAANKTVVVINATSMSGTSSGSGVIIGESENYSYIITCHHVIDGFNNYQVTLEDGSSYNATLVGGDPITDIAVISIEKTGLSNAIFVNDSNKIKIGSTAIAIGNPLGTLSNSVTKGIISALSRKIETSEGTVMELLQTDASINSGNSGGGLFNSRGELVGIVNAKYSATGVEGLGFAIPANVAREIAADLIENGYVIGRYLLGVTISEGYYRTSGFFGSSTKVVYISSVDRNGSAYGILEAEDILISIEIKHTDSSKTTSALSSITTASEVEEYLNNLDLEIGDTIVFSIKRGSVTATTNQKEVLLKQYVYK